MDRLRSILRARTPPEPDEPDGFTPDPPAPRASALELSGRDNDFYDLGEQGYLRAATEAEPPLFRLVVWGGVVANGGEGILSCLVDNNSHTLQRVMYAPVRTKGGCLIRPKYYVGNRSGEQRFENLKELAIRADPGLLPRSYGWVTPNLNQLELLVSSSDVRETCQEDADGPCEIDRGLELNHAASLVRGWLNGSLHWRGPPTPDVMQKLWHDCPSLQRVSFRIARWDHLAPDGHRSTLEW